MEDNVALPSKNGSISAVSPSVGTDRYSGPDFKVSGIFSSHMVLQRDKPIRVFGFSSEPGSVVTGNLDGDTVSATVDQCNKWTLFFPARPYCRRPVCLKIADDRGNTAAFEDILIGDVWIVGGQSNAEYHLGSCVFANPGLVYDENDPFRLFTQTQRYVCDHSEVFNAPQDDITNPDWQWKRPDETTSKGFSAMGWFFAKSMIKQTDVPQGLIMCCAGGAFLRELMPADLAHALGYFTGENTPVAGYYNSLIHPVIGLSFRGQLFFQGESEGCYDHFSSVYARDLALLVYDERQRFGFEFPFYNVQLSNYPKDGPSFFPYTDVVRVQQYEAAKYIRNYTLTVDMDLGSHEDTRDWAHSPYKAELGRRLAALVLAREYKIGTEEAANSPMPAEAVLTEDGKKVIVRFKNVNGGLTTAGGAKQVHGFSFGRRENRAYTSAMIISDNEVSVDVPVAADVSLIGYAFSVSLSEENADLRGGTALPVPSFLIPVRKSGIDQ